jgi:hypothetical protein
MATLKNTTVNDNSYFQLPVGTTAQRPVSPVNGMMRYNTTTFAIEMYNAGNWINLTTASVIVDYLVVAGGGGGAGGATTGGYTGGGGGGAGGLLTGTGLSLNLNTIYTVTVGSGGNAGTNNSTNKQQQIVHNFFRCVDFFCLWMIG